MVGEAETVAETEEADPTTEEAGPDPKEAEEVEATVAEVASKEVSPEVPVTPMGPQIAPARSIGNLGRGRGYAQTDTTVPGGTMKAPDQDTIETLLQLKSKKYKIEKLTSQKLY